MRRHRPCVPRAGAQTLLVARQWQRGRSAAVGVGYPSSRAGPGSPMAEAVVSNTIQGVGSNPTRGTLELSVAPRRWGRATCTPGASVHSALRCLRRAACADAENAGRTASPVKTIRRWRRLYQRRGDPRARRTGWPCPAATGRRSTAPPTPSCSAGTSATAASSAAARRLRLHIYNDRATRHQRRVAELMRQASRRRSHACSVPGPARSWCRRTGSTGRACSRSTGRAASTSGAIVLDGLAARDRRRRTPADFLRGLFHSDGCRVEQLGRPGWWPASAKRYDYPRWQFTNNSDDILRLVLRGARPARRRRGDGRTGRPSRSPAAPPSRGSTS